MAKNVKLYNSFKLTSNKFFLVLQWYKVRNGWLGSQVHSLSKTVKDLQERLAQAGMQAQVAMSLLGCM